MGVKRYKKDEFASLQWKVKQLEGNVNLLFMILTLTVGLTLAFGLGGLL